MGTQLLASLPPFTYYDMLMEEHKNEHWDELIPEILGPIFKKLPLKEVLTVIPSVCKSWRETILGPYCWDEINILEWSEKRRPRIIRRMLELLIPRSAGSLRKLSVTFLPCDSFSLIVEHGQNLRTLELPESKISNCLVESVAVRLPALTFMDLSFCPAIGAPGIAAVGKYCSNLTGFSRVMSPCEVISKVSRDEEALAIASTMQKLKRLEIGLHITPESVAEILESCRELELLDLHGCINVKIDKKLVEKFTTVTIVCQSVVDGEIDGDGDDDGLWFEDSDVGDLLDDFEDDFGFDDEDENEDGWFF